MVLSGRIQSAESVKKRDHSSCTAIGIYWTADNFLELLKIRFRFRFFIHHILQHGKCLESDKYTNISKQE